MAQRYVIDCSAAAKWVLPEVDHKIAVQLLLQYNAGVIELTAPDLLLAELGSLLAKWKRRKLLTLAEAANAYLEFQAIKPGLISSQELLADAMNLSLQTDASFWDCVYGALARREDCPLITADERLLRSRLAETVKIISMAEVA